MMRVLLDTQQTWLGCSILLAPLLRTSERLIFLNCSPESALRLIYREEEERVLFVKKLLNLRSGVTIRHSVPGHKPQDFSATRELIDAEMALAEEHGFREFLASGRALRAWALSELGEPEQGVAELETVPRRSLHFYCPAAPSARAASEIALTMNW
jgi:hypothetical protein